MLTRRGAVSRSQVEYTPVPPRAGVTPVPGNPSTSLSRFARHDLLAANHLARALYAPMLADPRRPANNARFVYLDPASREFFAD